MTLYVIGCLALDLQDPFFPFFFWRGPPTQGSFADADRHPRTSLYHAKDVVDVVDRHTELKDVERNQSLIAKAADVFIIRRITAEGSRWSMNLLALAVRHSTKCRVTGQDRPAGVCSVGDGSVVAVLGAEQSSRDENDLDHIGRPAGKVRHAAQTPKTGSAGRQDRSLEPQQPTSPQQHQQQQQSADHMESSLGSGESPSPQQQQQQTMSSSSRLRAGNLRHFHHQQHIHHHLHPHGQVFSFDHVPVLATNNGSVGSCGNPVAHSDDEGEEEVFSPGLGLTPTFSDRLTSPFHVAAALAGYGPDPIPTCTPSDLNPGFGCEICGQLFNQHDRLVKHLASRHKLPAAAAAVQPQLHHHQQQQQHQQQRASAASVESGVVVKGYQCDVCQRPFARSDMLTRHMRLHTGLKPYTCRICGQVFSRSDHLSTHQRTHTGEKPYRCPQCSYAACRRDMITRHLRTHTRSEDLDGLNDPRKDSG
nr:EOG090X0G73 [Simocephalus serrulatus]